MSPERKLVFEPLPISAPQLVRAGAQCFWLNLIIDMDEEDSIGALESGQPEVAMLAGRRMANRAVGIFLARTGVFPLPSPEEMLSLLGAITGPHSPIYHRACELDQVPLAHPERVDDYVESCRRFVSEVCESSGHVRMRPFWRSADNLIEVLALGREWVVVMEELGLRVEDVGVALEWARDVELGAHSPGDQGMRRASRVRAPI